MTKPLHSMAFVCLGMGVFAWVFLGGCSGANFDGSKKQPDAGNPKAKDESGAYALQSDADFEQSSPLESGEPAGCRLPAELRTASQGWCGADFNLTNTQEGAAPTSQYMDLAIRKCSWHERAKTDKAYLLVFNDTLNQKSYAERFAGSNQPANLVNCVCTATIANTVMTAGGRQGQVTCERMP